MKILYALHQFFPNYYTGTERFVFNLAKQMQRMGHQVQVLTYGITDEKGWTSFNRDLMYRRYVYKGVPVLAIKHTVIPEDVSFSITDDYLVSALDALIREDFDVVHIAHPMRVGAVHTLAKKRNIPSVLTLTDFWLLCPRAQLIKPNSQLCVSPKGGMECANGTCYEHVMRQRIIERYTAAQQLWQNITVKVSPSRFLASIFQANGWSRQGEILWVRHGIDYSTVIHLPKRKKVKGEPVIFGFIGTLLYTKGVHVAFEAWQKARSDNALLYVYGPCFHEIKYLERLKNIANGDPRIHFLGSYDHEDLPRIMSGLDVVIVPSIWWENSPLTLLISLAYGIPVIASNIGGMAEFVGHDENGWLFPVGDTLALAALIEKLAEDSHIISDKASQISKPPRLEEEAFYYESIYSSIK